MSKMLSASRSHGSSIPSHSAKRELFSPDLHKYMCFDVKEGSGFSKPQRHYVELYPNLVGFTQVVRVKSLTTVSNLFLSSLVFHSAAAKGNLQELEIVDGVRSQG